MRKDYLKMLDEARMCPDGSIFRRPLEEQADHILSRMRTFQYSRTRILKILKAQAAEPPGESIPLPPDLQAKLTKLGRVMGKVLIGHRPERRRGEMRKRCPKCGKLGDHRPYRSGEQAFFHSYKREGTLWVVDTHCFIPKARKGAGE